MSAHGIDIFNFEYWDGPPPSVPSKKMLSYNRAGAVNVSLQYVGKWSDPFEVTLTSHYSSLTNAVAGYNLMLQVIATGWLAVKYADQNYTGLFSVGYHALDIQQTDLRKAAYLIGPGYAYANGGRLVTRWTLQPEEL